MRKLTIIAASALALGAAGAGSAAQTRAYDLSGFNAVSASAGVTVVLNQGPFAVQAAEPGGSFDHLVVELHGSTLVVSRTSTWFGISPLRRYTVTVSAPDYVSVHASSGSTVNGQFSARDLEANANSGATLRLSGACASINADASSGATLDGDRLHCKTAHLTVSSGATLRAFADAEAHGNASSGGAITVRGAPARVDSHSSSGGSVRFLGA